MPSQNTSSSRPFAVFDIDGTLIRWQLYHAVVDKLASAHQLGPDAKQKLEAARQRWKNREHRNAFREYELTLVEIYESALPELSVKAFDAMVTAVISEYKDQVYTYTKTLLSDLQKKGYRVIAISGSHQELVRAIASYYGFDDYVGSVYERTATGFSGEKFIASYDKKAVLDELVKKHGLDFTNSVGIGDSGSDAAFLSEVEQPIAFNPDRKLYERARQENWKIVIERKNVVYELVPSNAKEAHGHYVLA